MLVPWHHRYPHTRPHPLTRGAVLVTRSSFAPAPSTGASPSSSAAAALVALWTAGAACSTGQQALIVMHTQEGLQDDLF